MSIGRICQREVHLAEANESVRDAAGRMGAKHVGTLVVLDEERFPIGILTDRDLAVRVLGKGLDPTGTLVRDVMTENPRTVTEDTPIEDVLAHMRHIGGRRMPVVGSDGRLRGVVSLDDILALIVEELGEVGRLLDKEAPRGLAGA